MAKKKVVEKVKVAKKTRAPRSTPPVFEVEVPQSHAQVEEAAAVETASLIEEVKKVSPLKVKETEDEKMARLIGMTVKAVMNEMVPAMAALQRAEQPKMEQAGRHVARWKQCNECKQRGPKGPPCEGQHTTMVVYPTRYPHFGKWFQGVIINGVRYLSHDRRQRILIPTAMVSGITKIITDFEDNEYAQAMGRTAEHDSGSLAEPGAGVTSVKEANGAQHGWR